MTRRGLALVVAAAALALPVPASAALKISEPELEPAVVTEFSVLYRVHASASGDNPHTRSEGAVVASVVAGEGSDVALGFIRDYASKTTQLSLPNNPYATLLLTRGVTYSVRVARWTGGGGGCGTCDEEGVGPARTIKVPKEEPKGRIPLKSKAEWSKAADRSAADAARLRMLSMLTFTSEAANALHEQAWNEIQHAREARKLALDPVDTKFKTLARARAVPKARFDRAATGSAATAINAVLTAQGQLGAELEALNTSIFRAQGAFVKRSVRYEKAQMLNAAAHAQRAARAASALAKALPVEVSAFGTRYPGALDQTVGQAQSDALAAAISGGGLPADDLALLQHGGATADDIKLVAAQLAGRPVVAPVTGAALIAGPDVLAGLKAQAKLLTDFATRTKKAPTRAVT